MAAEPTLRIVFSRAFDDYPAEHWIQLRTTNPIESTLATDRLGRRITKGPGSRAAAIVMAYKLVESPGPGGARSTLHTSSPSSAPCATFKNGRLIGRAHERDEEGAAA